MKERSMTLSFIDDFRMFFCADLFVHQAGIKSLCVGLIKAFQKEQMARSLPDILHIITKKMFNAVSAKESR